MRRKERKIKEVDNNNNIVWVMGLKNRRGLLGEREFSFLMGKMP
jgi:hypothetical protein